MTAAETILLAVSDLESIGSDEFTSASLVVAAWKRDPQRFGLCGYDYPDSNRVLCEIMGKKHSNPIRRGLIYRVRPRTYAMTNLGRAEAARLRVQCNGQTKKSSH